MAQWTFRFEHAAVRYGFAVLMAGVVTAAAVSLHALLGPNPSPPFLLAILIVAWVAGFGPAVVTCALSIGALDYFFIPPLYSVDLLDPKQMVGVPIFTAVALAMAWLAARRRRTERLRSDLLARERAMRTAAERVSRVLEQVNLVTEAQLPEVSADTLVRQLLTAVRTALATDTATILLLDADGAYLTPVSSDGLREGVVEDVRIPPGRGVAGRIVSSKAGMIFPDLTDVEVLSPFLRDRIKSLMGVPLKAGTHVLGVIHVGASTPRQFTEDDLDLLRLLAERVALVIDGARLHDEERAAMREAEAANRMKDEFLAMLSHELRSPLTAIMGWARMLATGTGGRDAVDRGAEVINRNARMMAKLVDDLLDVSRIAAGRLEIDRQPVDVRALVEGALDSLRPAAVQKGVMLAAVRSAGTAVVLGDPARLHQVISNLIANAIKFTPSGGYVDVRVRPVDGHVQIAVSDTGDGIGPEFLPHVFERFRQEDTRMGRAQGGLGLGLAIVRHLVELHGGTVGAESLGHGQGARFTVRLPVLKSPAQ